MSGEVGKETIKREMDNRRIYMTSHKSLFSDFQKHRFLNFNLTS